jgi:hypothetical protein
LQVDAALSHLVCLAAAVAVAGCSGSSTASEQAALTFDPCAAIAIAAPGATADQLAAIDLAIAMWSGQGAIAVARVGDPSTADVTISFASAGPAEYGFYDDTAAKIAINLGLSADQTAITCAHELGHAMALVHISPEVRASVMNPGNLVVAPNAGDAAALVERWGSCPATP